MSHVFISYNTKNAEYAYKFAERLREEGFNVWIDNAELRAGDNWWESIVRALRAADAFIVIMTPESRDSRWVQREIMLAEQWGKPAFPVLLAGENFPIYTATQYEDLRVDEAEKQKYPPISFYDNLAKVSKRQKKGADFTTQPQILAPQDEIAVAQELTKSPPPFDEIVPSGSGCSKWFDIRGIIGGIILLIIGFYLTQFLPPLPNFYASPEETEIIPTPTIDCKTNIAIGDVFTVIADNASVANYAGGASLATLKLGSIVTVEANSNNAFYYPNSERTEFFVHVRFSVSSLSSGREATGWVSIERLDCIQGND